METVDRAEDIKHPIVRRGAAIEGIRPAGRDISMATSRRAPGSDRPDRSTWPAPPLYAYKREHVTSHSLAEEACHIELELLKEPIGKQDQKSPRSRGVSCMEIARDGKVTVSPLRMSKTTLTIWKTPAHSSRGTRAMPAPSSPTRRGAPRPTNQAMIENLHFIRSWLSIKASLEGGDTHGSGSSCISTGLRKKPGPKGSPTNRSIAGMTSVTPMRRRGKLIGAGGGGFLSSTPGTGAAGAAMAREGLEEVRFAFDFEGSKILVQD